MEARQKEYRTVYVNAYSVGYQYGGPEEGGWWYDVGEPLASVPVLVEVLYYNLSCHCSHSDECDCRDAGALGPDDPGEVHCHGEVHDSIASSEEIHRVRKSLQEILGVHGGVGAENRRWGRTRTSAAGQEDLEIQVEEHVAEAYPARTPHYE